MITAEGIEQNRRCMRAIMLQMVEKEMRPLIDGNDHAVEKSVRRQSFAWVCDCGKLICEAVDRRDEALHRLSLCRQTAKTVHFSSYSQAAPPVHT